MRNGEARRVNSGEAGFSMIEMLLTAFILAVGILGLTMLQVMSMRAAGGSRNLTTAVQLTEQMMDQIELEGRLTYNNATLVSQYTAPSALEGLQYYNKASVKKYFNIDATTGKAKEVLETESPLFTLNMSQTFVAGVALSDVTVTTQFVDGINKLTNQPIIRTVTLTRRILHA